MMLFMVSSSYTPGLHNVTEVRGGQLRKGGNVGGSGTFDFNNSTGRDLTFFALTGIWAKLWDAEQKKKNCRFSQKHPQPSRPSQKSECCLCPRRLPESSRMTLVCGLRHLSPHRAGRTGPPAPASAIRA